MTCPSCGKQNPAEYSYCNHCGAELAPRPENEKKKTNSKVLLLLVGVWSIVFLAVIVLIIYWFSAHAEKKESESSTERYEFVLGDYSREQAEEYAIERGGHLAQFDSREEYDEVTAELTKAGKRSFFWIGAGRNPDGTDYYWDDINELSLNDPNCWCSELWLMDEPSRGEDVSVALCYDEKEKRWGLIDVPVLPTEDADTAKPYGILLEFD